MPNNLPKALQLEVVGLEFKQGNLPPDPKLSTPLPYCIVNVSILTLQREKLSCEIMKRMASGHFTSEISSKVRTLYHPGFSLAQFFY